MKTQITIILAALALSVSAANPIRLVTMADSVNYAFGVGNGTYMRRQILSADSTDKAKIQLFCEGYRAAKGIQEGTDEYLRMKAKIKGAEFAIETENGFLFGDSSISAKKELIQLHFVKGLNAEKWTLAPQEALQYIQSNLGNPDRKLKSLSKATIDSLNMCYGYFEGIQQRQSVLGADSMNVAKINTYISAFSEGIKLHAADKLWIDGANLGLQLTYNVAHQPFFVAGTDLRVDLDLMSEAILTAFSGEKTLISPAIAESFYQDALRRAQAQLNGPSIEKGRAFLRENAKRKEVHTTASGLQYEVITEGTGAKPASPEDVVKVHYAGKLIDGTEFDSSYKRGEPIEFPLNRVIKGWTEGVMLMREGGKYRLYIPYELGYGDRGTPGGQIPPYATLIFEIELIKVNPAAISAN